MNDILTVNLNLFERQFLLYLAARDNRAELNFRDITQGVIGALRILESKGAISRVITIGRPGVYQYQLTTIGTNLVDLIKEQSNG